MTTLNGLVQAFEDDACANCLEPMPDEKVGLFCCSWCQEAAMTVRWLRRALREGRLEVPETLRAALVRLAMLEMGGYQADVRRVSPKLRAFVIQRAEGRCEQCGAPGAEVDHIEGPLPTPENLQFLCHACHDAKTDLVVFGPDGFHMPAPADEATCEGEADLAATSPVRAHLLLRAQLAQPALLCDEEYEWQVIERRLRAARKARLYERGELVGLSVARMRGMPRARIAEKIADAGAAETGASRRYGDRVRLT